MYKVLAVGEGRSGGQRDWQRILHVVNVHLAAAFALRFALCSTQAEGKKERERYREREGYIVAVWLIVCLAAWLPAFCKRLSLQVLSIPFNAAISFAFRAFCHFALSVSALGCM